MGASQSSNGGAAAAQDVKTSYYELLGVERQATDEDIKKAYKKAALRLHPDRNFGNEEAATKTFAEVSAAYEVLSDPQERAWYDSHESAILRGDDATDGDVPTYENVRVTTADDLARLVRKFNKSVDFSDSPSGFFGFLKDTFEQLAKEEDIAANMENVDVREYPTFGHKDDPYDDVVKHFYNAWSSFSTVKSFSWKDQYRLSEAPDRWYRRRMESENNRLRQDGRREFNEAVRSLVAFVKKRDPRYVPNTQTEAERQKVLRDATAAQAARARAANEAKMNAAVPEWTKAREPEEDELDESEEEVEEEVFECVACDKIFKSEKQWEAHEKSKKHQKAIRLLQKKMRKDDKNFDLNASGVSTPDGEADEEADDQDNETAAEGPESDLDGLVDDEPNHDVKDEQDEDKSTRSPEEHIAADDDVLNEQSQDQEEKDQTSSEDEDYAPIETIQARMQSTTLESDVNASGSDSDTNVQANKPKKGKAAQKRAKKAAAAAAASSEPGDATRLQCEVCGAGFSSKNKLFEHIKVEGHAALKSEGAGGGKGKKKKAKR